MQTRLSTNRMVQKGEPTENSKSSEAIEGLKKKKKKKKKKKNNNNNNNNKKKKKKKKKKKGET